jgi:AcrR family transcriptional regulator
MPIRNQSPGARARPLPPAARRAALVKAILPLIRQSGFEVTTRQLATAANVAEGTLFRAFPTKDALIRATLAAAFDAKPVVAQLELIDLTLPLSKRLTEATGIVQHWLTSLIGLMTALHASRHSRHKPSLKRPRPLEVVGMALVGLIEPDRAQLRAPPQQVARWLQLLLFAGSHPLLTDGALLEPEEMVDAILDGARLRTPVTEA